MHVNRRPNHLGEQTFLFRKHTCDSQVHENFVDETLLVSCYDRYHLESEPSAVLDSFGDPPYPPDIIDFTGDTPMLLRAAQEWKDHDGASCSLYCFERCNTAPT